MPLERVSALLAVGKWVAVAGLFDPLTAAQARRLADNAALHNEKDRKLVAIILEAENTLLTAEARAVLIAALRDVQAVTIARPERWRSALSSGADVQVVENTEEEKARSAEFVQFIVERQQSASTDTGKTQHAGNC